MLIGDNMVTRIRNILPQNAFWRAIVIATTTICCIAALAAGGMFGVRTLWPMARDAAAPYLGNGSLPLLEKTRTLCAEFRDAAGLYTDNKVLLLGVEVGAVTSVANQNDHVVVHFTVPADLDLPADVGAASYTQSVITNRSIELTKPYSGGPKFTGDGCIPLASTFTPVTVTESFAAINNLSDTVMGTSPDGDPAKAPGVQALAESLKSAAHSVEGTGGQFRQMLSDLDTMVGDPYKADADYRQLFQNASILTSEWLRNWDSFSSVMSSLPGAVKLMEGISSGYGDALHHYAEMLPIWVQESKRFADRATQNIFDKLVPWLRDILNAYTPNIVSFFTSLPPVINWLADDVYLPNSATQNVTYVPPRVAISPAQASAICTELRARNTPGVQAACSPGTASDPVTLGLTNLIMGAALS